jgi:hypothetical protein
VTCEASSAPTAIREDRAAAAPLAAGPQAARRRSAALCGGVLLGAALAALAPPAQACSDAAVTLSLRELAAELDPRARRALRAMPELGRRLLAARAYLRAGAALSERWSWSGKQLAAYQRSGEYRALRAELARVQQRFAELNPGYTLYVNLAARSTEQQLERWNGNPSVSRAGVRLQRAARRALCRGSGPSGAPLAQPAQLRRTLLEWRPSQPPALAAPGLSLHGQLRAFDFQVQQGESIVAGPNTGSIATVWTAQGWTERLRAAVRSTSRVLEGPLQFPDEPWHYSYRPPAAAAAPPRRR